MQARRDSNPQSRIWSPVVCQLTDGPIDLHTLVQLLTTRTQAASMRVSNSAEFGNELLYRNNPNLNAVRGTQEHQARRISRYGECRFLKRNEGMRQIWIIS